MSNTLLPKLYKTMKRIRTFEERVSELFIKGESAGTMLHLSIGEELGPACVGTAMQENDTFTTHHRGHGIVPVPVVVMAELTVISLFACNVTFTFASRRFFNSVVLIINMEWEPKLKTQ